VLPLHPYVQVFDLRLHEFVVIDVRNLKEYGYDTRLADKLVLREDKKEFVEMLISSAGDIYEDIVKGKGGGIIVLATGDAGIGKTLTAECYSERIKRPLYVVQCSQLGTDEVALEKNLLLVLSRASRWKAVLLIDEADVYVHERGEDLQQNAVVGVFLRILEYYTGLLFLTSNRATIIDDAIMSRVTAHVRYERHTAGEVTQIWRVLSLQTALPLESRIIAELVEVFPHATGRNVKMLLKLGTILHAKQPKRDLIEIFKFASQFVDITAPQTQN
jgi:AAA+ superfamily predicted ATPase